MKIIITESQYKLIFENEETEENKLLGKIMYLIESFDETNIDMAFEIAKGFKIKPSTILEHYEELFKLFKYKPSVINLKKITKKTILEVYDNLSKMTIDLIFKLPNLKTIYFYRLNDGDLDELVSTNKNIHIYSNCKITSIPNLTSVDGILKLNRTKNIKSLPKLKEVGTLELLGSQIESLPNLISVRRNLGLQYTPLGKELKDSGMSEDEIKNKFGVKGKLFI
jgi:hypothetical protein